MDRDTRSDAVAVAVGRAIEAGCDGDGDGDGIVRYPAAVEHPDPAHRRKAGAVGGRPVAMGGATWLVAQAPPRLGPAWDALYDSIVWSGRYEPYDVRLGAFRLLEAHYELTAVEGAALVLTADYADLVDLVHTALFGVDDPHLTLSDWFESAAWSNGIDPARVPAHCRMLVLRQWAETGRAIPEEQFVKSRRDAGRRGRVPRPPGIRPYPI